MSENPRRGRQARNFTTNVRKILDLKSSSEQIFSENCRWVPLKNEENEPGILKNKLLITDYAKVKKYIEQRRLQPHANHDSHTFQLFKSTRIQVFHDNNGDFKSRTLFVGGERCPVALFQYFVDLRPLLQRPCMRILICFFLP